MMKAPRLNSVTRFGIFFLLSLLFLTAFTLSQAAADNLFDIFDKTYNEIIAQVKKGTLQPEIGTKANEFRLALKKYLIKSDAELEILQLDVLHGSVENRQASLEKMMAISAECERIKMGYLQRLIALKGENSGNKRNMPLLPVLPKLSKAKPEGNEAAGETAAKNEEDKSWSWKDIKIEVAPEKLDRGLP